MRLRRRATQPVEPPDDDLVAEIFGNEVDGWEIKLYDGNNLIGTHRNHGTYYEGAEQRASQLLATERRRRQTAQEGEIRV